MYRSFFFFEELTKCLLAGFYLLLFIRPVVLVNDVLSLNSAINKMCKSINNASCFNVERKERELQRFPELAGFRSVLDCGGSAAGMWAEGESLQTLC